jgi:putative membrane protein
MYFSGLLAFLHFLTAFAVIFCIIYEKINFKQEITTSRANQLRKADSIYGLSALLVLIIGFIRVFYFEKGSEFYFANAFFHLKLAFFVIIGLLSIYPTIVFYRWGKLSEENFPLKLPDNQYKQIRRILLLESILVIFLLLSASLMAKGVLFF